MDKVKIWLDTDWFEHSSYYQYKIYVNDEHFVTGYIRPWIYYTEGTFVWKNQIYNHIKYRNLTHAEMLEKIKQLYYWLFN